MAFVRPRPPGHRIGRAYRIVIPRIAGFEGDGSVGRRPYVEKLNAARLTLTLPVLNQARRVIFLAAGKEKASIMRDVLSDNPPSTDLPASLVQPRTGARLFLLDQDAAALIEKDLR